MTDTHDLLGPELEGLLREAAADPRSRLLRVPRPARVGGLLEAQEVLRPSATELTSLDRHLLNAHRAELADLLLRTCGLLRDSHDRILQRTYRPKGRRRKDSPDSWTSLNRDVDAISPLNGQRAEQTDALALVLAAMATPGEPQAEPSLTELARLADRLSTSSRAMAWIAFDQGLQGRNQMAIRVVDSTLPHCTRVEIAAVCLETLGMAHSNLGHLEDASRAYRAAFERDDSCITAIVGWMHYAIQSGDWEEAALACRTLDGTREAFWPGFEELLVNYELRGRAGSLIIAEGSREVARRVASIAHGVSRRVIDVYL